MITILAGPPGSGKTTYALKHMSRGDLILDMDSLYQALSGLPLRDKPDKLLPFVCAARDAVVNRLIGESQNAWVLETGSRDRVKELAWRLSADIVVLEAPTSVCRKRMIKQGRKAEHVAEMVGCAKQWHREWA